MAAEGATTAEASLDGGPPAGAHPLVVVLTGGPCAGKTTALGRLTEHFKQAGIRTYAVPEAATLMWASGAAPADLGNPSARVSFQAALMRLQLQLEDSIAAVARASNHARAVLLCDRGAMDGKAYMGDAEWAEVLARNRLTEEACHGRYDCVVHLVTAADGALDHYVAHELRREGSDEAVCVDRRTGTVWSGHPRRVVIDNSTDLDGKLARVCEAVMPLALQAPPGLR